MKKLSRSWLWRGLSFKHRMHVHILLTGSILVINNAWIINVLFFTDLFLATNLNAIVLPCKLQCSAGKWRSWKSAVQESPDAGGVICRVNTDLNFQSCLDMWLSCLDMWKGGVAIFWRVIGAWSRACWDFTGYFQWTIMVFWLLWGHACIFQSVHHLQRGLIAVWEQGQCFVILGFTVNCGVDIHINSKCFCSQWVKLQNCKGMFTNVD